AFTAVGLLESVNYFEHWGLARPAGPVRAVDSWDSDGWFTLYSLVGLSRHADHHADATRPYPALRPRADSPKLPTGYYGMVAMAQLRNAHFQRLMTAELRRRRLGPFAADAADAPVPAGALS
ncbi:MAG TPA: fatty acid desaturase, partial [Myxococcota bacterium]|nr:fatty acid desaturase [Myxococcota bacterium]